MATVLIDGKYSWYSADKDRLNSIEKSVTVGDVRFINGKLFRAFYIWQQDKNTQEVMWCPLTKENMTPHRDEEYIPTFS